MTKKTYSSAEMLKKLVSFDTTSHKSNLELMGFVQNYLDGFGIASELIFDATKNKANLHAVIGPKDRPGVVLSGHTDVVPVEGQAWDSDPFTLRDHDGFLYGRGTCDMKGFIAVALAKVPEFVSAGLKSPVHFALSYDEEVGCLGAHSLAEHITKNPVLPMLCIVGEPTMMKPIVGHKGVCDYDCMVRGLECHSSLAPYGVNAVEYAAELIAHIKGIARRQMAEGPFNKTYDPPFTTVHTGTVKGGTAVNIVPNSCEFVFEIRAIPEVNPEDLVAEIKTFAWKKLEPMMKAIDPKTGFDFKLSAAVPAFDTADNEGVVSLVLGLSGANSTAKVSFGTEAGIFQKGGIPTVVCGPGNIAQAHKPNEFVTVDQLTQCEQFMNRLVDRLKTQMAA